MKGGDGEWRSRSQRKEGGGEGKEAVERTGQHIEEEKRRY